jgi:hypothetical protein
MKCWFVGPAKPPTDVTWVELGTFKRDFPSFQLEDELVLQEGRDVMTGIPYRCRGQRQPNLSEAKQRRKEIESYHSAKNKGTAIPIGLPISRLL